MGPACPPCSTVEYALLGHCQGRVTYVDKWVVEGNATADRLASEVLANLPSQVHHSLSVAVAAWFGIPTFSSRHGTTCQRMRFASRTQISGNPHRTPPPQLQKSASFPFRLTLITHSLTTLAPLLDLSVDGSDDWQTGMMSRGYVVKQLPVACALSEYHWGNWVLL